MSLSCEEIPETKKIFQKNLCHILQFFLCEKFRISCKINFAKRSEKDAEFMKRNVQQIHENLQNFALIYFAKNYHVYCEIFHF